MSASVTHWYPRWRRYSALTSAAERTLAAPGSEEVVLLATHRVTWTYEPHIDLLVDGRKVTSLELQMTVVFDLHGVAAVVQLGDLVALRGGGCLITATLAARGTNDGAEAGAHTPRTARPAGPARRPAPIDSQSCRLKTAYRPPQVIAMRSNASG